MRLTACLLLGFSLHLSAATNGQTISYTGYNVPLTTVFNVIKQQTGYLVVYNADLLDRARPVSVSANNTPLEYFLQNILNEQPLEFSIVNKTIVISEKEWYEAPLVPPPPPLITVQGYVYDSLNRPLDGASVMIKGTKKGTQTDASGYFKLQELTGNETLVVSYNTFETQTIPVNNRTSITVVLKVSPSLLDQMVVQGYGTSSRRYSVGSISTVTSEDIERQPVPNVLLALQGQVPGLIVTPTGGAPGSAVKLQIRGQNTLSPNQYGGNFKPLDQPLFIIDGVPFAAQNNSLGNLLTYSITTNSSSVVPGNGISPFNNLNPADIESISILRDAEATSIYGSQGANGVVLITTKKGKPGKPQLNITANTGINAAARPLELLNTRQYLAIRREAAANDGTVLPPTNINSYPDVALFDSTRYVDWYDEFFNVKPPTTDLHVSLSGGQQYTTFMLSGGYTNTGYNFPGNFKDERFSLHSAYTYRSPNNKLTVQFITDYSFDQNNASSQPNVSAAMSMPPNYPALVDENDDLIWRYKGLSLSSYNQYARLRTPASVKSHNLNSSIRLAYQILPGLSLSTNVGYNRLSNNNYSANPLAAQDPGGNAYISTASFTSAYTQALNIEPQLDYQRNIGNGVLSLLAGGTYKKQSGYSETIEGRNYPNDDLLGSVSGAVTVRGYNSSNLYKYAAVYARAGYIYDRRYIISLTGRRDGSSNFGPGRRWGNFGSVGLGWIFTEEAFMENALTFLSYGKISGNYGTNGSDGIAPYNYQAYYQPAYTTTTLNYQGLRPYSPTNLYNPDYSWSVKKAWNAALDLGFLQDRLLLNFTWYRNRSSNQLIDYTLPDQAGFPSVLGNFPATVQNSGLELSINSTIIKNKDFNWQVNFNISGNRNKLVAFPGLESSPYASAYTVGKSTSVYNGFRFAGLNTTTGLYNFYNSKDEVVERPNSSHVTKGGDVVPLFNLDPDFSGGMGHNFIYKSFSLSLFFQFSKQIGRNYLSALYTYGTPGGYFNLPVEVLGRYWQKPGDDKPMQRLSGNYTGAYTGGYYFINSDGAFSDASYVRLKTVSFSWNLPRNFLKKTGMKDCRVYVNAQNLLTFTGYEIGDPEQAGYLYTIPLQRTIVAGLSVNF